MGLGKEQKRVEEKGEVDKNLAHYYKLRCRLSASSPPFFHLVHATV